MDIPTKSPYDMIPMEQAISVITSALTSLPPENVHTMDSLHRVLAADIHSPMPHPPFRASVKDGYAIHPATASSLTVVSESHAGSAPSAPLHPGQAAYVTTGAPVPPGATAVVMVEHCSRSDHLLTVHHWPAQGDDIRPVGHDLAQGQLVLSAGTHLSAADVGLLAACAVTSVPVVSRPVVGVMSTGDEVLDLHQVSQFHSRDDAQLPFGRIIDSNRPMLLSAIREALPFATAVDLGRVPDDYPGLKKSLSLASARCHVVVTSGGVSMGKRDLVKPVLDEIAHIHFGRVLMKPGKPLTFATVKGRKDRCFVALPGNPVSCFVCFHMAVAIAARRLAGWSAEAAPGSQVDVHLAHDIRLDKARPEYHRAVVRWSRGKGYVGTSTGKQASSRLASARGANALLMLPAREGSLAAGDVVQAWLLNGVQQVAYDEH